MGKNHEITVKLDKDELEKIKRKAKDLGLKPSVYLRMVGLAAQVPLKAL